MEERAFGIVIARFLYLARLDRKVVEVELLLGGEVLDVKPSDATLLAISPSLF
jgi:hypothetical protein